MRRYRIAVVVAGLVLLLGATSSWAGIFFFSTGNPDGKIGTLSQQARPGLLETETADDFILTQDTSIELATFTGLLPVGTSLSDITNVEIEVYHVFPKDSADPPSGHVFTRVNSPADVEIGSATRDGAAESLFFFPILLNSHFTVANTVVTGIHPLPYQFTGGEGPATGKKVLFVVVFTPPIVLPADHYFFRPEVGLTEGTFLWLSAPKPIVKPGTPFSPDLQSWIRNSDLKPDWLRIGTDITHQGPFNAAFSLIGFSVP